MNILNVFYSYRQGGVEHLGIAVANQMAASNQNTSFVCIISDNYSKELVNKFSEDVKLFFLKKEIGNHKIGYLKQLVQIIKTNHINIMHIHQGNLMPFFFMVKCLCPKTKLFFTVHDTFVFSELANLNRIISMIICKRIIAISEGVREDISACGIPKGKIVRIYNGVDFRRFPIRVKTDEKHIQNVSTIVNVARFIPEKKGQDVLIKATAILVNKGYKVRIVFVGGEPEGTSGEIDRMIKLSNDCNIAENVIFMGNVDDVPKILKEADIFCIPSNYEGFGISAVEAMGIGLPCVASDIVGLNEVVNEDKLGLLFQAGNVQDLANKIEYVILDKGKYDAEEIGQNMRNRFSIESMCKQLIETYTVKNNE